MPLLGSVGALQALSSGPMRSPFAFFGGCAPGRPIALGIVPSANRPAPRSPWRPRRPGALPVEAHACEWTSPKCWRTPRPRSRRCWMPPPAGRCSTQAAAAAATSRRRRRQPPRNLRCAPALGLFQDGASAEAVVEQISGAMTNLVFRCSSPAARQHATVIVRVFGSGGKLFSQRDERNIFLLASDLGLGPKCLVSGTEQSGVGWGLLPAGLVQGHAPISCPIVCRCTAWDAFSRIHPNLHLPVAPFLTTQVEYENGRVEEFLPGDNLSHETLRQPDVSAAIAGAMARFHVRMLAGLVSLTVAQQAQQAQQQAAAANGLAERQRQAERQLRPAIFERILKWYAAAVECGADVQAAGLAAVPQEVRGACA